MKISKIGAIIDFVRSILALINDLFNVHNIYIIWNKCDICFEKHEKNPKICIQKLEHKLKTLKDNLNESK
jgi:hypothetical protein